MTTRDTYAMLAKGETEGVFQLESTGMTQVLVRHAPEKPGGHYRSDLAVPPGPDGLYSNVSAQPQDPHDVTYKTPQMAHIVDVTNGCVVYQEQVMQICRELAGFPTARL